MREALKREFITQGLAQDGLGLGNREKPRVMPDGTTAVTNDNGILFAVYGYMQLHKWGMIDGADFLRFTHAVKSLEVEPGLHKRRPDATIEEAHDNRVAIAIGALMVDNIQIARDLQDYGDRHGYQFSVQPQNRGSFAWKRLLQGGDIAILKLCAGRMPYMLEWIWMIGGMLTAVCKGWCSTWNLFYLRSYGVDLALSRFATSSWGPFKVSWAIARPILHLIASKRFGGLGPSLKQYFGAGHILYKMETHGSVHS
jgi:hypothetical protein